MSAIGEEDGSELGRPLDEEVTLPKSTMVKLISDHIPVDMTCTKETKELISNCCIEFIHLIASESNDICEKENKKMITGEHVIAALHQLGYSDFVPEIEEAFAAHQKSLKEREKRSFKLENTGMTEEELLKSQEELFKAARMRMQQQQE